MISQASVREFIGVRCNLQRFCDCKMFYGWVDAFNGEQLCLRIKMSTPFVGGEEFHVELHGKSHRIIGRFRSSAPDASDLVLSEAIKTLGDGQNSVISQFCRFEVVGECRLGPAIENFRVAVSSLGAKLHADGISYDCWIGDISEGGMGIDLKRNCAVGDSVEVHVPFRSGDIRMQGTIRSISGSPIPGANRIGLQVTPVDRVEAAKWNDLLKQNLGDQS